jgi:hypothetical protein
MYTFLERGDHPQEFHVYKHHDGYPTGAAEAIANAISNAWKLPRFEADEFGAAFVAANKAKQALAERNPDYPHIDSLCQGSVRLMETGDWKEIAPGDLAYRYEIFVEDGELYVKAFSVHCSYPENVWEEAEIFAGKFEDFQAKAGTLER